MLWSREKDRFVLDMGFVAICTMPGRGGADKKMLVRKGAAGKQRRSHNWKSS